VRGTAVMRAEEGKQVLYSESVELFGA